MERRIVSVVSQRRPGPSINIPAALAVASLVIALYMLFDTGAPMDTVVTG